MITYFTLSVTFKVLPLFCNYYYYLLTEKTVTKFIIKRNAPTGEKEFPLLLKFPFTIQRFLSRFHSARMRWSRWSKTNKVLFNALMSRKYLTSIMCAQGRVITTFKITESEVVTGKSQTEALPYWPSDSEVNTVGRGLRFSWNDRTGEVIKLFMIWLMN